MKKYSMYRAPFMSFYSGDFYRDVGLNWSGTGFGYLFLLLLVCLVPKAVRLQFSLTDFARNSAPELITQVPEIKIVNGEASSLAGQPYTIHAPVTGKALAIVDTTGATASLEGSEAVLLVKKTEILVKSSPEETRKVSFREISNFKLNQNGINYAMGLVLSYGVPLFFVLALIGAFLFRMAQALLYGALGLGMANLLGASVPYSALLRLSVMAVTPVIIATTAADVAGVTIPHAWLLGFAAALGFLFLGVKSVSGRPEPVPPAPGGESAPV